MFIIYDQLNRYSLLFLSLTFFMTYTRSDAGWVGCTLLRTKLWINVVYSAEAGTFERHIMSGLGIWALTAGHINRDLTRGPGTRRVWERCARSPRDRPEIASRSRRPLSAPLGRVGGQRDASRR